MSFQLRNKRQPKGHLCNKTPLGCDTFVAFYPTTPKGITVFGKNSDRPAGEGQSIRRYPAQEYESDASVACTYITIPQANKTYSVLLSQIDWMWGAEHGANEMGVVIGNEAVWTKAEDEDLSTKRLLGMDLLRLGLERGSTAKESMQVITELLEEFGQGGPCAEGDETFVYHNSFLIADFKEAWILETAGRNWVAKCISEGARNISNTLTIRDDYDLTSRGLYEYAKEYKLGTKCKGSDKLDWALCFGDGCVEECASPSSRQNCGRKLLHNYSQSEKLDERAMMKILKSHDGDICMHGGFETSASMVSALKEDGNHTHWMIDRPHPCKNQYLLQRLI
jgi:secernin